MTNKLNLRCKTSKTSATCTFGKKKGVLKKGVAKRAMKIQKKAKMVGVRGLSLRMRTKRGAL